jgi:Urea transporter
VALAIGGFYLLPSPRSYLLATIATILVALLNEAISVFWAAVGLPVHALPYNLVTMMLLYLLTIAGSRSLVRIPQASPEKTLDRELTARRRYQGSGRAISLPFSGPWTIWQGCHGPWTHQGLWCNAYDFVIRNSEGETYGGTGQQLADYYAFQKPVLSPIRGWVVGVVNDLPDCAIGTVDTDHNWGNYVLLYDERGFYSAVCLL